MRTEGAATLSLCTLVVLGCQSAPSSAGDDGGTETAGTSAASATGPGEAETGGGASSGDEGGGEAGGEEAGGEEAGGEEAGSTSGDEGGGCKADPDIVRLFEMGPDAPPVVQRRSDGVIVTRGAGRVRGRHELEGTYNTYGERYFENRSYGFEIEDHVANGESRLVVTYRPEADVSTFGPGTNFRVWKIYGDGNVFHDNRGMDQIDPRHLEATIEDNRREGRPLQVGDVMEFEFGIFIAGQDANDPNAIEGRTSYYTDTFRYQVGVGGLTAVNSDTSGILGPDVEDLPGGATTIPYVYAEPDFYFSQMALDMQPENVQAFLGGRRLFHTDFSTGEHSEQGNPILAEHQGQAGPMFNVTSCSSCHVRNGRGLVEPEGEVLRGTVVKLYAGGTFGAQLQPQEAEVSRGAYEMSTVDLADGTTLERQRPTYTGLDQSLDPSVRRARQLVGLGLLEAVSEDEILKYAVSAECDSDTSVSGRPSIVADPVTGEPRLGRFGWKAERVSVPHQIAGALLEDIGVTTTMMNPGETPELSEDELDVLATYMRLIAVPPHRNTTDPQVETGRDLFASLGCVGCHRPEMQTAATHPFVELHDQTIQPYTDLLLHDMGDDLAGSGDHPLARLWRTPPLWGLGLLREVTGELRLLHDGRARSVIEAVSWHGGEATQIREAALALSEEERAALAAFVESI